MKLREISDCIEQFAPLNLQEDYDNSGLILGDKGKEINKAILCVDVTEDVVEEAVRENCDIIISHHPVIFGKGLKKLGNGSFTERVIIKAIKKDIAIYTAHTNLDNYHNGLNRILCDKLGVKNTEVIQPKGELLRKLVTFCPANKAADVRLALFNAGAGSIGNYDSCSFNAEGAGTFRANEDAKPYVGKIGELHTEKEVRIETIYPSFLESGIIKALLASHPYEEVAYDLYNLANKDKRAGAGLVGELEAEFDELDFLLGLKEITEAGCIRHSKLLGKKIKKVAVCTGSGSFLIKDSIIAGADILITADMKYHQFFDAENRILIADIGHYESEQFVKELLYSILNKKFPNFAIVFSKADANPVYYL